MRSGERPVGHVHLQGGLLQGSRHHAHDPARTGNSTIPRSTSSSLVFSAQNIFRHNYGMPMFDPEMSGNDGFNPTVRYISEHIPAPAVFLTSLRVSF